MRKIADHVIFLKRAIQIVVVPLLLGATFAGCTTCDNLTVASVLSPDREWTADVEYRVCGYVSGFSVALYRSTSGPLNYGEGGKEPFQASIRTEKHYEKTAPPVSIKWTGDRRLLIHHNTRMSADDSSSKLKVTKADRTYEDVTIDYEPEPVIWE